MAETRDRPVPLFERLERLIDAVIPPADEVVALASRGEKLLAAGDALGALYIADVVLGVAPGYLTAVILRADSLAARARYADALDVLATVARERSVPVGVQARMCEFAARSGSESEALGHADAVLARAKRPDAVDARRLLAAARVLRERGAHAASSRLARAVTMLDPEAGGAWLMLGHDAFARGERARARTALDRAVSATAADDTGDNRLAGELALALGDHALATRHLRRAWITGDADAIAPLVVTLARADDARALERVLLDAEGTLAMRARALVGLDRGVEGARDALASVTADEIPGALWPLALEITLRRAPAIATRWATEAPSRPGATAVRALGTARDAVEHGRTGEARVALGEAFADPRTVNAARELYAESCRRVWTGNLALLLDEIAALVRDRPAVSALEGELRARRRELDDPLRVAILGEFSAGKSTFLNALVGTKVSPMGVLPTTAQVHWLRFGDPGARVVDTRGAAVVCTVSEAAQVVETKREAGETVDYVEVTLPSPRLARVELIDTPGFNAGDPAHEAAVRRAFDIADVAIWLFDARQAGKATENSALTEAREASLPVLGVLNKLDQVKAAELPGLVSSVRAGFAELCPLVLALSAREALAATIVLSDPDAGASERTEAEVKLAASGMATFLAYMDEHLLAQRAAWKQFHVAHRALALLDEIARLHTASTESGSARREVRERLALAVETLRTRLETVLPGVREETARVVREQGRRLRDDRRGDAGSTALFADATAEVVHRARVQTLASLDGPIGEVTRLAIECGVVAPDAGTIVAAPVSLVVEYAIATGAAQGRGAVVPSEESGGDPFAPLLAVLARRDDAGDEPDDRMQIAVRVARDLLVAHTAPALPLLG